MPNLEGVAKNALAAVFAYMEGTGIGARNAKALVSARTEKRGMCAILAAARAFAPMAVTGTGAPNAGAGVFVNMAGAKMLAGIVALHSFLFLLHSWLMPQLPLKKCIRALPMLSRSRRLSHECTARHQHNFSFHIFIIVVVVVAFVWVHYTCNSVNNQFTLKKIAFILLLLRARPQANLSLPAQLLAAAALPLPRGLYRAQQQPQPSLCTK